MDQMYRMAWLVAELRSVLEIYRGFFEAPEDPEVFNVAFREIAATMQKSLSVRLIAGCAAVFTDPSSTCGDENMSFHNLHEKYRDKLSAEASALWVRISGIVSNMNLAKFRHKYVGHFGLNEHLSSGLAVQASITNDQLHELLVAGEALINMIIRDAGVYQPGNYLAFYQPIPESRSTAQFLRRLRQA